MFCTNCGKQLPDGYAFCTNCGEKVDMPELANSAPASNVPQQTAPQYAAPQQTAPQYAAPAKPQYAPPAPAQKKKSPVLFIILACVAATALLIGGFFLVRALLAGPKTEVTTRTDVEVRENGMPKIDAMDELIDQLAVDGFLLEMDDGSKAARKGDYYYSVCRGETHGYDFSDPDHRYVYTEEADGSWSKMDLPDFSDGVLLDDYLTIIAEAQLHSLEFGKCKKTGEETIADRNCNIFESEDGNIYWIDPDSFLCLKHTHNGGLTYTYTSFITPWSPDFLNKVVEQEPQMDPQPEPENEDLPDMEPQIEDEPEPIPEPPASVDFSTTEKPDLGDFLWYLEDVLVNGIPQDSERISDLSEISGGWKCLVVYDPYHEWDDGVQVFANLTVEGTEEELFVTTQNHIRFIESEGISHIEDDQAPMTFKGEYENEFLYVTGPGNINIADFYALNGKQYAVGTYDSPDGMPAVIALVRP